MNTLLSAPAAVDPALTTTVEQNGANAHTSFYLRGGAVQTFKETLLNGQMFQFLTHIMFETEITGECETF